MPSKTRKCIATGEIKSADALLRFVKAPDSRLLPDFNKHISGRGLYVTNSKMLLKKALDKNMFIKSIHLHLKITDDFAEQVENLLYQNSVEKINCARKTGILLSDADKIKEYADKGDIAFILSTSDNIDEMTMVAPKVEFVRFCLPSDQNLAPFTAFIKSNLASEAYKHIKRYQTFIEN